jgi:hypothetical protein
MRPRLRPLPLLRQLPHPLFPRCLPPSCRLRPRLLPRWPLRPLPPRHFLPRRQLRRRLLPRSRQHQQAAWTPSWGC